MTTEAFSDVSGVYRVSARRSNLTYWYWVASWIDEKRHLRTESYPEATFGEERAKELACAAKKEEVEFANRVKAKGLTSQDRKLIRKERLAAMTKRLNVLRSKSGDTKGLIRGVRYEPKGDRYVVNCSWANKRETKSFSVKKFGDAKAKELAIDLRRYWEEENVLMFYVLNSDPEPFDGDSEELESD